MSQLRSIAREAGPAGDPLPLSLLFSDLATVARVLREQREVIAATTARSRLIAARRFIEIMASFQREGWNRDATTALATLDTLLPAARPTGWHRTGIQVAGVRSRRRLPMPTLSVTDLHRLVDAALQPDTPAVRAVRDQAVVAVLCFSGLRPEELERLCWEHVKREARIAGTEALTAIVNRSDRRLHLPIVGPAAEAIKRLAASTGGDIGSLDGPVFRVGVRSKLVI